MRSSLIGRRALGRGVIHLSLGRGVIHLSLGRGVIHLSLGRGVLRFSRARALVVVACLAFATQVAAQTPAGSERPASERALLADLTWLCADERKGRGRDDAHTVARWIRERFREGGLEPLFGEEYLQPFRLFRWKGMNVGGVLPGKGWPKDRRHVIVSAHHDHLGIRMNGAHPGAADNAAGVAAMLAIMRDLAKASRAPDVSVVFLAFDLEEAGLVGSGHYARNPALPLDDLMVFTTMDIMGREFMNLEGPRLVVLGAERAPPLADLAARYADEQLELVWVGTDVIGDRSDYAAFRNRSVPYLFFTSGENRDYHRPTDTVKNLDLPLLDLQARFVGRVVRGLCALDARPDYSTNPVTHAREIASLGHILALLRKGPDPLMRRVAAESMPDYEAIKKRGPGKTVDRTRLRLLTVKLLFNLRKTWKKR